MSSTTPKPKRLTRLKLRHKMPLPTALLAPLCPKKAHHLTIPLQLMPNASD